MSRAAPAPLLILTLLGGAACVPEARSGAYLRPTGTIFVDGGFDDSGNPIDGGVMSAPDTGVPGPDGGGPGRDGSVGPEPDAGIIPTPPDASVVNVVYDECPDNPHSFDVPIIVDDEGNAVARAPALTGFLVPFEQAEALYSLNSLVVVDAQGERLPAQFEVLSRWGSGREDCSAPIRFAYAHVSEVPAPGAQADWRVRSVTDNPGEVTPLNLQEDAQAWVVDTGVARFTVNRAGFQGLSKVELADGQGGHVTVSALAADASGFLVDHGGEKGVRARAPWYLAVERRGPQVVTIAARGFYASSPQERDLAYTIRLHFYAGSATVKVDHTYYHGEVAGWGADGISNRTEIDGAVMRIPFANAREVRARADREVHTREATEVVQVEQIKRSPGERAVRYAVRAGGGDIESGEWADHPRLAVAGGGVYVEATLARMAQREPQGLAWNPGAGALEVQMTSTPIWVGGARGIWTVAALDFGAGAPKMQDSLQLHAERPLLGTPAPGYVNGTRTIGPYAATSNPVLSTYASRMEEIHNRTRDYFREFRVTGIQLWPDLPRSSCHAEFNCDAARNGLFEGGDNNYWNWSKPGIDEFFRTGNNAFIYDFSLGEARTYVETLAVRTDHDRVADSSVTGLAVCYGDSRGYGGDYREGLNNRRDRCVADYSYDKTLKLAFLATADARFVDFFEEAGESVVNAFGAPPERPDQYLEVDLSRLSEQRLEVLSDGAEFARDPAAGAALRSKLSDYVNFMLGRTLIDGHHCMVSGSGNNDAKDLGSCGSNQAWMMPVGTEWALRTSRFLGHAGLHEWVVQFGLRSGEHYATLSNGVPDFSASGSGWRTVYRCDANGSGVPNGSCQKVTNGENGYRFYANGLMAFLNVFGLTLSADPSDPNRVCDWLPSAYQSHMASLNDSDINGRIWGKTSGQAFGMSGEAVGALSMCP